MIDAEPRRVMSIIDMPMAGSELLVRELVRDIEGTLDGRRVGSIFIERQVPFAKAGRQAGATSAFSMGQRFMAIKAIAACFGWPVEIISPSKWQQHFSIKKADKERSLTLADQLMPEDADLWSVRRGHCNKAQAIGRCEAVLIGLYGVRTLVGIHSLPPLAAETIRDIPNDTLDDMIDAEAATE